MTSVSELNVELDCFRSLASFSASSKVTRRRRGGSKDPDTAFTPLTDTERELVKKFEKRLDACQKEATWELRKKLDFRSNILGINQDLRNGR